MEVTSKGCTRSQLRNFRSSDDGQVVTVTTPTRRRRGHHKQPKREVCGICYKLVPLPCVACRAREYRELKGGAA